jgi:hypothetical protein
MFLLRKHFLVVSYMDIHLQASFAPKLSRAYSTLMRLDILVDLFGVACKVLRVKASGHFWNFKG